MPQIYPPSVNRVERHWCKICGHDRMAHKDDGWCHKINCTKHKYEEFIAK